MGDDVPGSGGAGESSNAEEILSAIELARSRASDGKHAFLVYLLDMAWLEATNLAAKEEE